MEPFAVSAISGSGTGEMMDRMVARLPPLDQALTAEVEPDVLSVAIVGRPNVGKSSLLNALCGEERAIVSAVSGTTRDAIDTDLELEDGTKCVAELWQLLCPCTAYNQCWHVPSCATGCGLWIRLASGVELQLLRPRTVLRR